MTLAQGHLYLVTSKGDLFAEKADTFNWNELQVTLTTPVDTFRNFNFGDMSKYFVIFDDYNSTLLIMLEYVNDKVCMHEAYRLNGHAKPTKIGREGECAAICEKAEHWISFSLALVTTTSDNNRGMGLNVKKTNMYEVHNTLYGPAEGQLVISQLTDDNLVYE